MISSFMSLQFMQFLGVGVIAALCNFISRIGLSSFMIFPLAITFAYAIGTAVAFDLNRRFVFPHTDRPIEKQMRDFIFTNLSIFPIVWFTAILIRKFLIQFNIIHYAELIAHAIAIALPAFITFLIYKFCVFKKSE